MLTRLAWPGPRDRSVRGPRDRWLFASVALFAGVTAVVATAPGVLVSPDSVVYLAVAERIVSGEGMTVPFSARTDPFVTTSPGESYSAPLIHFPPVLPVALSILGLVGVEGPAAARILNVGLYAGSAVLSTAILVRFMRVPPAGAALGVAVLFAGKVFVEQFASALSEPLLIFGLLLAIYLMLQFIETGRYRWLIAVGAVAALASLTRYVGIALVPALAAVIVRFFPDNLRRPVLHGAFFSLLGAAPLAVWLVRVQLSAGTVVYRSLSFHPPGAGDARDALGALVAWWAPGTAPALVQVGAGLLMTGFVAVSLAAGAMAFLTRRGAHACSEARKSRQALSAFAAAFVVSYTVAVLLARTLLAANIPFDRRILAPLATVVVLTGITITAAAAGGTLRRADGRLAAGVAVILLVAELARLVPWIADRGFEDLGYASPRWEQAADVLAGLPPLTLYSDRPEAVFHLTGRSAFPVPRQADALRGEPNPRYGRELAALGAMVSRGDALVVFFDEDGAGAAPPEQHLVEELALAPMTDSPRVRIYSR